MTHRVLVAHGNTQRLRQAVQDMQRLGFEVVATPDGGDAFARFFEVEPILVICSASLPSLSGPNFARMVHSQSPQTPVIILRDADTEGVENEYENIHVVDDPFDVAALRSLVPSSMADLEPHHEDDAPPSPPSTSEVFVRAALRKFQRSNNLLALLDESGVQRMAAIAETRTAEEGELLIRQGDQGDGFFFLVEGEVRVTLAERGDEEVARINAGGFFGEMALLNDQPRSASVSAIGPCTLLWFSRHEFLPLLDEYTSMRNVISGVAEKRTEENLWRVLFDDDEVTKSLEHIGSSSLLDGDLTIRPRGFGAATHPDAPIETKRGEHDEEAIALDLNSPPQGIVLPEPVGHDVEPEPEISLAEPDGGALDAAAPHAVPEPQVVWEESPPPRDEDAPTLEMLPPSSLGSIAEALSLEQEAPTKEETDSPWDHATDPRMENPSGPKTKLHRQFWWGLSAGLAAGIVGTLLVHSPTSSQPERPGGATARTVVIDEIKVEDPAAQEHRASEAKTAPGEARPDGSEEDAPTNAPSNTRGPRGDDTEAGESTEEDAAPLPAMDRKTLRRALFSHMSAGRFAQAARVGERLRGEYGLDWESHLKLGDAQRKSGDSEGALATYRAFINKHPGNVYSDEARLGLGQIFAAQKKYEDAKRVLEQAIKGGNAGRAKRARDLLKTLP